MPPPLATALVTGASAGLGRELVRRLVVDRGLTVLATARRLNRLEELKAGLPEGKVRVLAGDLADPAFRQRLWDWAEAEAGPGGVDLLVNNAGVGHYAPFADADPEVVRRILDVNVEAVFDLTRRAIRSMRGRGSGEIVQVSSILGTFGIPYSAAYVASKHAVEGLVKSVRPELRGSGVRLWALRPGRFASEFRREALDGRADGHEGPVEPVEAIARGLIRGLGGRRAFVAPTIGAAFMIAAARWLPGPFEALVSRMTPGRFARDAGLDLTPPARSAP